MKSDSILMTPSAAAGGLRVDREAPLPESDPAWVQGEIFDLFHDEIVTWFDMPSTAPTRVWQEAAVEAFYWGPLNDDNQPHGRGLLIRKKRVPSMSLMCCQGDFVDGQVIYASRWWFSSKSRDVYEGDVAHARKHGFGRVMRSVGSLPVYEGSFRGNHFDGLGTQRTPNGEIYVGWFKGGRRHGPGYWQTPGGTRATGHHQQGVPKPPVLAILSGERGIWHGDLQGDDPFGEGLIRHSITRIAMRGPASTLAVEHVSLPKPSVAITNAEGQVSFTTHIELLGDDIPDLDAFRRALAQENESAAHAIVTRWRQLSPPAAQRLMCASDHEGRTALHLACLWERGDLVEPLLALGADAQASATDQVQPLHLACGFGASVCDLINNIFSDPEFTMLYAGDTRPDSVDSRVAIAVRRAIAQYRRECGSISTDVIAALVRAGADPRQGRAFLIPIFNANQPDPLIISVGITPFELAVLGGHQDAVKMMLDMHDALFMSFRLRQTGTLYTMISGDVAFTRAICWARGQPPGWSLHAQRDKRQQRRARRRR